MLRTSPGWLSAQTLVPEGPSAWILYPQCSAALRPLLPGSHQHRRPPEPRWQRLFCSGGSFRGGAEPGGQLSAPRRLLPMSRQSSGSPVRGQAVGATQGSSGLWVLLAAGSDRPPAPFAWLCPSVRLEGWSVPAGSGWFLSRAVLGAFQSHVVTAGRPNPPDGTRAPSSAAQLIHEQHLQDPPPCLSGPPARPGVDAGRWGRASPGVSRVWLRVLSGGVDTGASGEAETPALLPAPHSPRPPQALLCLRRGGRAAAVLDPGAGRWPRMAGGCSGCEVGRDPLGSPRLRLRWVLDQRRT